MMISYIILNTIIYGVVAYVLASYRSYAKMMNFSICAIMIGFGYVLAQGSIGHWGIWEYLTLFIICIGSLLLQRGLLRVFVHEAQREQVSLIVSRGYLIVVENALQLMYGSSSVGGMGAYSVWVYVVVIIVLIVCATYLTRMSYYGKILAAQEQQEHIVQSLGVNTRTVSLGVGVGCTILLCVVGWLLVHNAPVKITDSLFYLIKGLGIMIAIGATNKQWIIPGALCYVVMEYLIFIQGGISISHKEGLVLIIILLILLFKPQGLFSSLGRLR